jgi:putative flippase GtrA
MAGAAGTAAHYAVLIALVETARVGPVPASIAGFCTGAIVNYTVNRGWVFRSRRAHREALPRFFAIAGVGLVVNALLMQLLTDAAGWPYLAAQVVTTGLLLLWHYAANAFWTFREPHHASR